MQFVTEKRSTTFPAGFDYEPLYDRMVETAPPVSTIVEVGVFLGKSLIYLAKKARESGKRLRIIGVDTFQGSPEFEGRVFFNDEPWSKTPFGVLALQCLTALKVHGVLDEVTLIVSDSLRAAELFADESVHAVFIDADHSEPAVIADIDAWSPKVAPGGILGGHDIWTFPDVKAAVDYKLPNAVYVPGRSWWEVEC